MSNDKIKSNIIQLKSSLDSLKDNNIDLSEQKSNIIEAINLQQLQKERHIESLLDLDYKI